MITVLATARSLVEAVTAVKPGEQVLMVGHYTSHDVTLDALAADSAQRGAEPTIVKMAPRA
jgi:hypothetical protein